MFRAIADHSSIEMDPTTCFSPDYRSAREQFLASAREAGARLERYTNPEKGPEGETLSTDVALLGDPTAERVLLANSATHGAEGFCGSGAMVGWLRGGFHGALPGNVRVVLVHAINPFGFAWLRRVNEDNVDLNRNFIDHDAPHPLNPDYDALHPYILPQIWDEGSAAPRAEAFAAYVEQHGEFALQRAVSQGQYEHGDGVFYGGTRPVWSHRTFNAILEDYLGNADHIGFIDFHTGLGPYGTADLITVGRPGDPGYDRVLAWYENGVSSPDLGDSTSVEVSGDIKVAISERCADAEVTSVTAEYGTYSIEQVLNAVVQDNWLHVHGDPQSAAGRAMKAEMRKRFYPDEDDWKELVFLRARQIMQRAIHGLASDPGA